MPTGALSEKAPAEYAREFLTRAASGAGERFGCELAAAFELITFKG